MRASTRASASLKQFLVITINFRYFSSLRKNKKNNINAYVRLWNLNANLKKTVFLFYLQYILFQNEEYRQ